MNLWQKILDLLKENEVDNKPDAGHDAPDSSQDTAREVPSKDERETHWLNIFKIKF